MPCCSLTSGAIGDKKRSLYWEILIFPLWTVKLHIEDFIIIMIMSSVDLISSHTFCPGVWTWLMTSPPCVGTLYEILTLWECSNSWVFEEYVRQSWRLSQATVGHCLKCLDCCNWNQNVINSKKTLISLLSFFFKYRNVCPAKNVLIYQKSKCSHLLNVVAETDIQGLCPKNCQL